MLSFSARFNKDFKTIQFLKLWLMNRRRTEILDVGESTLDVDETTCRRKDPKAKRPVTGYHQYLFYGHIRVVCRDVQNCKFSARLIRKYRNRMNKPIHPPPPKKKKNNNNNNNKINRSTEVKNDEQTRYRKRDVSLLITNRSMWRNTVIRAFSVLFTIWFYYVR